MELKDYKEELISLIQTTSQVEMKSDREVFFDIFAQKLEEAEVLEDYEYLYFSGIGSRNRKIQVDGHAYNELEKKVTLVIIPPLAYYENLVLTTSEAEKYFNQAKYFFLDAEKIKETAEESSAGYGLAIDIIEKKTGKNLKKEKIEILELVIFTDMSKSDRIKAFESKFEDGVRIDYSIYDLNRMKAFDDSISGKEEIQIDLLEEFGYEGIPCLPSSETDEYEAYLANIPGILLAKLYDKYQSRLLEGNVRSFLQTTGKVNKGIRNTILNNPEMFFAYNNGIAATAEEIETKVTERGLVITSLKSLQIVNGGQTTASLASAFVNDKSLGSLAQLEKIFVPMKLSVVSHQNAEELIPNISRYANSQNKVSDADLSSNHQFYREFERISRSLLAPTPGNETYWYFERATGQYKQETYRKTATQKKVFEKQNPKKQMFKKVDLAKYYNIYLQKPDIASAGGQKSFNAFGEWMLKSWDKNENFVTQQFYKEVICLGIFFKETDELVRKAEWYQSYKANIVAYALSMMFFQIEKQYPEYTIDFNKIWRAQTLSNIWLLQLQKISRLAYENLVREDRPIENVTEWAKRKGCWEAAQKISISFPDNFIEVLTYKEAVQEVKKNEVKDKKEKKKLQGTIDVYNLGCDFWKDVHTWGVQQRIWTGKDQEFLDLAIQFSNGVKMITDKQAMMIMNVLDKAREESYPR
ncbi:MAG: AIPR family protein [Culicoidibacterales bacterium]